jgi:hypothetical protein
MSPYQRNATGEDQDLVMHGTILVEKIKKMSQSISIQPRNFSNKHVKQRKYHSSHRVTYSRFEPSTPRIKITLGIFEMTEGRNKQNIIYYSVPYLGFE